MICHAVAAGLALAAAAGPAAAAGAEPFKITNIHFETNASACDMGIQMSFDTDGVSEGWVKDPNGQVVYRVGSVGGPEVTHDITEGFQERVEPQIVELGRALGCERDAEEPEILLTELLSAWPEGKYIFGGQSEDTNFRGFARLSHKVPAGPEILAPEDGAVVRPDEALVLRWKKVTDADYSGAGARAGRRLPRCDCRRYAAGTSPSGEVSGPVRRRPSSFDDRFLVAKQFLRPDRVYEFEILATEAGGNQTISEGGVFCTQPIRAADCEKPE